MIVRQQKHSSDDVDLPARYASGATGRLPSSPSSGGGVSSGGRSVGSKVVTVGAVPAAATDVIMEAKLQVC